MTTEYLRAARDPDGNLVCCQEEYAYVVIVNRSEMLTLDRLPWECFRWCKSLSEAENCLKIDVPNSNGNPSITDATIIECFPTPSDQL